MTDFEYRSNKSRNANFTSMTFTGDTAKAVCSLRRYCAIRSENIQEVMAGIIAEFLEGTGYEVSND